MRVTTFLAAFVLGAASAAPAGACIVPPGAQSLYWATTPETLGAGEVALEVVFVRHPAWEELWPRSVNDDVIVTNCGSPLGYTFRVLRVLRGDYNGATEINSFVWGWLEDEFKDGQSRIVVGRLQIREKQPALFVMRSPREPAPR